MKTKTARSVQQIIESKARETKLTEAAEREKQKSRFPAITVSRQAGSEGYIVAQRIAEKHTLLFYDKEIIEAVAESAKINIAEIENLDERRFTSLDDIIASVTQTQHLWSSDYLRHLRKVIRVIEKEGNAVIIGRGAHLILPNTDVLRLQFIAPFEMRVKNIAKWFDRSLAEAKHLVMKIDNDRQAYIKKYFNADIYDSQNYDLVINMANITVDEAVAIVDALLLKRQ
ncbi:MAG: cytidylate kinase-like family protein [Deltaproteobacteria bacterium]|nr:cytidylate kinase-like family protein [Deltaproteobacteria bacterium]